MIVRAERPGDVEAVRAVNLAAFESSAEANLVDALRLHASPLVSIVAEDGTGIVGHILFSPVTLQGAPTLRLMGLAPMAVTPLKQRQGIGGCLVREGLARCREEGAEAVVVLGHPAFYPRFGFHPASDVFLRSEYDVPDEAFMVCELRDGALRGISGTVRYHSVFSML